MRYDTGVQTLEIAGTVFTLRDVAPSDCTAVLSLHRRVFGSSVDAAWFDWKYQHGGGEAVGLWQGNELVAHCGGTPRTVVTKLNTATNATIRTADVTKRIVEFNMEPIGTTPEELGRIFAGEVTRWGRVAKDAGMKAE